jgi:hypothetical protein
MAQVEDPSRTTTVEESMAVVHIPHPDSLPPPHDEIEPHVFENGDTARIHIAGVVLKDCVLGLLADEHMSAFLAREFDARLL